VVRQFPSAGRLSSFDKVTLVLAKPQHGVVPKVVGLSVRDARAELRRLQLTSSIRFGSGKPGRVVAQEPGAGVAAAPGMKVRLVVARG
jgi:beta-lactam-binding protein with PASTA domain